MLAAFFVAAFLAALGYIFVLRYQVDLYKNDGDRGWTMLLSNLETKKMLIWWIEHHITGEQIAGYLQGMNVQRIAIYGMAKVGELLKRELENTGITVVCGIDRSAKEVPQLTVIKPEDFCQQVDAVIVVPIYYFTEIYHTMRARLPENILILGLDEIICALCSPD